MPPQLLRSWEHKKKILAVGNPSLKKKNCFLFEGMKVREDWLVQVNLFYKESNSKRKKKFFFLCGGGGGGGGLREGGGGGLSK